MASGVGRGLVFRTWGNFYAKCYSVLARHFATSFDKDFHGKFGFFDFSKRSKIAWEYRKYHIHHHSSSSSSASMEKSIFSCSPSCKILLELKSGNFSQFAERWNKDQEGIVCSSRVAENAQT